MPLSQQGLARKTGLKTVTLFRMEENKRLCVSRVTGFGYEGDAILVMCLTTEQKYRKTQNAILCQVYLSKGTK